MVYIDVKVGPESELLLDDHNDFATNLTTPHLISLLWFSPLSYFAVYLNNRKKKSSTATSRSFRLETNLTLLHNRYPIMFSSVFVFVLTFMLLDTPLFVRAGLYVRLLPCMRVEINMDAFC